MVAISAVLYFLAHHPFWSFPLILFGAMALGVLVSRWRGGGWWAWLTLAGFLFAQFNIFTGHILNAWFLDAAGTRGTAVIVDSRATNSTLNDSTVYEYDAVLKTADGRDVDISFDTMSASTWPIRNAILIPPQGAPFVAKYVPGFERNIAIMVDESDYGKVLLIAEDREPVQRAARRLEVSPGNPRYIAEYRAEVAKFLARHERALPEAEVETLRQSVRALPAP